MSSNTFKKVTKQKRKTKKAKKQKGGVNFFSKSKSVSNINNDEKKFIKNQNEIINELNSELLTLDKQNKSYMRISKRFPHLNLQEIIDFEKIVRENGGSIETHSGFFLSTKRIVNNWEAYWFPENNEYETYNSWTCCSSHQTCFPKQKVPWSKKLQFAKKKFYLPYFPLTSGFVNVKRPPGFDYLVPDLREQVAGLYSTDNRFNKFDYNPHPPKEEVEAVLKGKYDEYYKKNNSVITPLPVKPGDFEYQYDDNNNLKNPRPELKCDRPEIFYLNEEDEEDEK